MSLDIQIKVDPGNSVAKSKEVEVALGKVEDQAEAIGPAVVKSAREGSTAQDKLKRNADVLARSFGGITEALQREQAMLDRIHGPMKRAAEDAATLERLHKRGAISASEYAAALGKAAGAQANPMDAVSLGGAPAEAKPGKWDAKMGEMRTGVTMGVASQLLGNAGDLTMIVDKLKEATGIPIGGTGTALGFMFGGPMGAAAGTAIEAVGSLIKENTHLADTYDELVTAQALSGGMFAEGARAMINMHDEAAKAEKKLRPVLEVLGGSVAHMKMLTHQTSLFADLAGNAADMFDRLGGVLGSAPVQKFIKDMGAGMAGMRAQLDDINGPLEKFKAGQQQLDVLLAAGTIKTGEYTLRMGELTQAFATTDNHLSALTKQTEKKTAADKAAADAAKVHAEAMRMQAVAAMQLLERDILNGAEAWKKYGAARAQAQATGIVSPAAVGLTGHAFAGAERDATNDAKMLSGFSSSLDRQSAAQEDAYLKRLEVEAEAAKKSKTITPDKELERMLKLQSDLADGFGSLAGSIADMATSGKASFADMTQFMATQLLQLLAMQAFEELGRYLGGGSGGKAGGALGSVAASIPAFATGGYIPPGGSGGTDSQLMVFRKSPTEAVHINTPAQEAAYRGGGRGGGGTGGGTQNISVHVSQRNMVQTLESPDGRKTILRLITEEFPHLRTGRGRG